MAKNKETETEQKTVVINGEEHNVADLSPEQIGLLNQVVDLDGKIGQMSFNLAQAQADPEVEAVSGGE